MVPAQPVTNGIRRSHTITNGIRVQDVVVVFVDHVPRPLHGTNVDQVLRPFHPMNVDQLPQNSFFGDLASARLRTSNRPRSFGHPGLFPRSVVRS